MSGRKIILVELAGPDGGMFPYMAGLSREIAALGYKTTILTSRFITGGVIWPPAVGVQYPFGGFKVFRSRIAKLLSLIIGLVRFWILSLRARADVKNIHVFQLNLLTVLLCLTSRLSFGKTVLTVHDITPLKGKRSGIQSVMRLSIRMAHSVVVHNDFARECIRKFDKGATPILVMPHGVDVPSMGQDFTTVSFASDIKFGLFGNMKRTKGILDAIEALAIATKEDPRLYLDIIGRDVDELTSTIESLTQRLNLQERCRIDDRFLDESEFLDLMSKVDVVLVPYNVIFQSGIAAIAASLGKPIIASDLPGLRSTLGNAALYFQAGDVGALSRAMIRMSASPALRSEFGAQARLRMSQEFSWNASAQAFISWLKAKEYL